MAEEKCVRKGFVLNDKIFEITKYIFSIIGNRIFISYACIFIASILEIFGLVSILPLIKLLLGGGDNNFNISYFEGVFVYLEHVSNRLAIDKELVLILIIISSFLLKAYFAYFAFGYSAKLRSLFILDLRTNIINNVEEH